MSTPHVPAPPARWDAWTAAQLLEEKARRGSRISLVLPARDEAGTVGQVVERTRDELVERVPLLDEVVVIDSDSSDDTAAVAEAAGAVVHRAAAIRPELGPRAGKGEAMWKSLFVTSGDLVVFMDADLVEWDTHFVTGLLGPLLTDDDVCLVKGCYDRPLAAAPATLESEGGRVTELVARPLIALHRPELSWVVQPLAGEWAARRSLLERLPLPCGYAVELAVLLDTHALLGDRAVAQVDLGVRRHGHQPLRDLGAMALELQALVEARVGRGRTAERIALRQFEIGPGGPSPVLREVDVRERPPAQTVPGYGEGVVTLGARPC